MSTTTSYLSKTMVALLGTAVLSATALADTVIYNNSTTSLGQYSGSLTGEYGDQINFAGTDRTLTDFKFQYFLSGGSGTTADFKIYANDGALVSGHYLSPGTLLYDSSASGFHIPLTTGNNVVDISGLSLNVPDTVTWTVSFNNVGSSDSAGLALYDPPTVGSSYDDFWVHNGDGTWSLNNFGGSPVANFAAEVTAVPEPSVIEFGMMAGLAGLGWISMRRRAAK